MIPIDVDWGDIERWEREVYEAEEYLLAAEDFLQDKEPPTKKMQLELDRSRLVHHNED